MWYGLIKNFVVANAIPLLFTMAALGYFGYTKYKIDSTVAKNEELVDEVRELKSDIRKWENRYSELNTKSREIVESNSKLSRQYSDLELQVQATRNLFNREQAGKKSFSEIVQKKPSLLQRKMQKATDEVIECINGLSGYQGEDNEKIAFCY